VTTSTKKISLANKKLQPRESTPHFLKRFFLKKKNPFLDFLPFARKKWKKMWKCDSWNDHDMVMLAS
jgi:hypothetical protein